MLVASAVVLVVAIALVAFFISRNNQQQVNTTQTEQSNTDTSQQDDTDTEDSSDEELVVATGPVAFSAIGKGILDAKDSYSYFSFENGQGTCMEQGFPTNMIYDSENIVKTEDDTYMEDYTSVDFLGNIRFDTLPLSTGSADCLFETSLDSDVANLNCSVNEVSVCTATFDLFAHE